MRWLLVLALALVCMGQDCEPAPPPGEPNAYCQGTPAKGVLDSLLDSMSGAYSSIFGGEPSTDRRATALVHLGTGGYCSGTVMTPRTVLTAAHCLSPDMSVTIGAQTFQVADTLRHPDYRSAPYNDLALLFFEQDLPGPYVSKVYDAAKATECGGLLAQGWGKSETSAVDLNESDYRVVKENIKTLYTKQLNTGGICFGDSGGPLYAMVGGETQIAGVTSTTYSNDCLIGGDHVRLSYYVPWLEENTR
jgi:secreted trypsin-like serine protease